MSILPPAITAGLLLAAIPCLCALGLPAPTASAVLEATGAARTTAYAHRAAIEDILPQLVRPPGRPSSPAPVTAPDTATLRSEVTDYLMDHPGAVGGNAGHRRYGERYRLFVLDLCRQHQELPLEVLADVSRVPLGTLKDWLRGQRPQVQPDPEPLNATVYDQRSRTLIEAVLMAWRDWGDKKTGFQAFCKHVNFDLRISFGRQHISDILESEGVRIPKRRGRPLDASQMRGGFESFFAGALWSGDGKQLVVQIGDQHFALNLELMVDAATGAFTGASIRPNEDAAAVIQAFTDGVQTTGDAPLAVLLDNKPSNHCDEVDDALGDTLRIRPRPFVPTDKPHVEGAFGLFAQATPPLVVLASTPEQLAVEIARLVVTTWARAVNNRPRTDRDGKSRAQLYREAAPTEEDIEEARAALRERQRKQERAREARARRQDPVVRALLDVAFARLGLDDPDGHLRAAIASWPLEAVINAIAVFEGKKKAGTFPADADARYLRGIVRNLVQENEGWEIAEALLRERLAARDHALDPLVEQRDELQDDDPEPEELLKSFVEKALAAPRRIDRTFWLLAAADVITDQESPLHRGLLRLAARRIHATFSVPHKDRLAATRLLFARVLPVG